MNQTNASPTLNTLFQRILARKPDAIALADPLTNPQTRTAAASQAAPA